MNLNELLTQSVGLTTADLRGAALAGSLPLTNAVIDALIARKLASSQLPVTSVKVDAQAGDSLVAEVSPRAAFVPTLRVQISVVRQPVFPADPVLHLQWKLVGMGALSAFAGPILAAFKTPPPGVTVTADRVTIDVREVLHSRGLGEAADSLRELELRTQPGAVVIRFSLGL